MARHEIRQPACEQKGQSRDNECRDNRALPQTPSPLVHPPSSWVPDPINIPPIVEEKGVKLSI